VAAQAPPSPSGPGEEMAVTAPEAVVYSGPGEKCFRTLKLQQGQHVRILRKCPQDPNWLEIQPPYGSFSYINHIFVQKSPQDPRIGVVCAPDESPVDILPGSAFETTEPNVVVAKVVRGTMLTFLPDGPVYAPSGSGAWVRIMPTPQEVRYIQASAVRPVPAVQRASANSGQTVGGMPVAPAVAGVGTAQTDPALDAVQKMQQIIASRTDLTADEKRQALDHVQNAYALMKSPRSAQGGVAPTQIPGNPNAVAGAPGGVTGQLASRAGQPLPIAQNTVMYNTGSGSTPAATPTSLRWSSWGMLRKASFLTKDGQPMYALLDNQGKPILYATPEAGKTLDPYVNQLVAMYGAVAYRSDNDLRMDVMTVSYVAPTQPRAGR
jgi:hypothetical protein